MNYDWILGKDEPLKGFPWRPEEKTKTLGITIWSDIFLHDAKNGDKIGILLMDTQGISDSENSSILDKTIFALTSLISSVQIFNLAETITEDDLMNLQFAVKLGYYFKEKTSETAKPFQNLLFLIRDWSTQKNHAFGFNGGYDMLENVLKTSKDQDEHQKSLEKFIYKTFKKVSCFLMPHPGDNFAAEKFHGCWSGFEKIFLEQLKIFIVN